MIKGRMVRLRKVQIDDLSCILKWRQDPELSRYYDVLPINIPLEVEQELRNNLKNSTRLDYIVETYKGAVIGMIYLKNISWKNRNAELHTMVGERSKRHILFGAEAELLLLLYAFHQLNMHKIYGRVIEYANEAKSLIGEAGFEKEAVLKQYVYQRGRYWDVYIYGIINQEFERFTKSKRGRRYISASQGNQYAFQR